jgi:hypothetical protein
MKLLASKYKTVENARKRAQFENAVAPGEFRRGETAKLYRYSVVQDDYYPGIWRVARDVAQKPGKETP